MLDNTFCLTIGYNNWNYSKDCLSHLKTCVPPGNIYFLDNGSLDFTNKAYTLFPDIKWNKSTENKGYAKGFNYLLRLICDNPDINEEAKILIINNDALIKRASLSSLCSGWDYLQLTGKIPGMIAPLITYGCVPAQVVSKEGDKPVWAFEQRFLSCEFPHVCALTTKKILLDVGLYDENIAPHGMMEDIDFNWRIRRIGYGLFIDSEAFAFHYGSKTVFSIPNIHNEHLESQRYFNQKITDWETTGRLR